MVGWLLRQLLGRRRDKVLRDPAVVKNDRAIFTGIFVFLGASILLKNTTGDGEGKMIAIAMASAIPGYIAYTLFK